MDKDGGHALNMIDVGVYSLKKLASIYQIKQIGRLAYIIMGMGIFRNLDNKLY